MSWKFFKNLKYSLPIAAGSISLYYISQEKLKTVQGSWTTDYKPSVEWDANWDHRSPTSIIKPLPQNALPVQENEYNEKLEKYKPKATRHLILIRHGQYKVDAETDKERVLTELGREQAKSTGVRLKELQIPINTFVISTMTRAQETGKIILSQLGDVNKFEIKNDSLIEEGAPVPPEPKVGHWRPQPSFFIDGSRIEAGFREHFHRADPSQKDDSYTILVCHANVIRYFVCRALQIQPEAWLRISLHHASLTWISIYPSGRVILRMLGDCGHMPKKLMSTK